MDRPKHRWFIVLAVLFAGVLLLFGRQWVSTTPEQVSTPASVSAPRAVESKPEPAASAHNESAATDATPAAASPRGGTLRGRIIDAVTRQPIREFEVRLIRPPRAEGTLPGGEPIARAFQSETGRFTWSDAPLETWQVVVAASGYQHFDAGQRKIVAGEATREIVMPLRRGYVVRGRVFESSTGAAIADAGISFREAGTGTDILRQRAHAKSKKDGSFVLDGVPGGDVVLTVSHQEHASRDVEVAVDEKTPPQKIALSTGATVAGMVTTITGVPVKGSVMLGGTGIAYHSATDEAGRFSFEHLPAGDYSVSTSAAAGRAQQDIVLGPDEHREDIVLIVGAGRSIRGTVRGLRAEQLKTLDLSLQNPSQSFAYFAVQPDDQGAYVINGVPSGQALLTVQGAGRKLTKIVDVPANQDIVVDIVFPPGARLSGRVTRGGKPAANRTVWISTAAAKFDSTSYHTTSSEDGHYEFEALPPGNYRIEAEDDIGRSVTIAGDAVLNIDIPLVQLAGRVVENGSAVPIVRASVFVRGNDSATADTHIDKTTDDFGDFSLTGVEPGEIQLTVYKPGYALYREKIAYSSPITNKTIALSNDRGVEIRVRRSRSGGQPVRRLTVIEDVGAFDRAVVLQISVDREGIAFLPGGLAGSSFVIYGPARDPVLIHKWDGSSLDLAF